jgi:phosphorylcholine metabolism protein LicD
MVHIWYKKKKLKKINIVHFRSLSALNMQKHFLFLSSFEHVNFTINEKYFKKHYDNPNCYDSLVIFQTYKNAIIRSVHSLEWLL